METVKVIEHEGMFYLQATGDALPLDEPEVGPFTTRQEAERAALEKRDNG